MKNQKGITLVALVITIIVLLILAGVSISLVIGNNGVLTQASNSVIKNNVAAVKEDLTMALSACETTYYTKWAQDSSTTRQSVYDGASTKQGTLAYELAQKGYTLTTQATAGTDDTTANGNVIGTAGLKLSKTTGTNTETYTFTFKSGKTPNANTGLYELESSVSYKSGDKNAIPVNI